DVIAVAEEFVHVRGYSVEAGPDHLIRAHPLPHTGQRIGDELRRAGVVAGADDTGAHPAQRAAAGGQIGLDSRLEAVLRVFGSDSRREVHRRVDGVEAGRDRSDALRALGIHGIILRSASSLVNGSLPPRPRRTGRMESMTTARTRE